MSDTPQSERGEAQRDDSAAEQGRTAMQAAMQYPITQAVTAQKGAAELFLNGLELSNWANRRSLEMTKDAMDNYLQTLDRTAAQTERVAEENAEMLQGAARTQREIGEESVDRLAEEMEEGIERSRGQFHSTVERFPPATTEQAPQPSAQGPPPQGAPPQGGQPTHSGGSPSNQDQQPASTQDQQAPAIQGQGTPPKQDQPAPPAQSQQGTTAPGSQPPRRPPAQNEPAPAAPSQPPAFQPPAGQQFGEYGNPQEQGQPPAGQPVPEFGNAPEGGQPTFDADQQAPLFEGAPGGPPSPDLGPQ